MESLAKTLCKPEARHLMMSFLPALIVIVLSFLLSDLFNHGFLVAVDIIAILISYAFGAHTIYKNIEFDSHQIPLGAVLYVVLAAMYIMFYSMLYGLFDLASPSTEMSIRSLNMTDSIYFSTATFTTLGFGDFLPNSTAGKWTVITQSILGTVHTVFFVLIFLRNGQPTRVA